MCIHNNLLQFRIKLNKILELTICLYVRTYVIYTRMYVRTYIPGYNECTCVHTYIPMYVYMFLHSVLYFFNYCVYRNGIFHRDVKPENILIKGDVVKLADFGSCRSIYSHQPYTEYISTRWYRAPECLLTDGYYSYKMDIWSAGCVLFELAT